jgi:glycosyltransferase involved in cell wall biosynthesis
MRVAMIDPSLFTWPYDRALLQGLGGLGHQVTLHSRRPEQRDGGTAGVGLAGDFYRLADSRAVRALPHRARLAVKGVDHAWSMTRLLARLSQDRPDVIHMQWLALPLVDRFLLGALARVAPLVLTVHDTNPFNGHPSSWLQSAGHAACQARFRRLIVHTAQGRDRLIAQGTAPARIAVLPHGLLAAPATHPPDAMDGTLTFLLFGKIKDYKGADVLIRAFALLPPVLQAQARVRIVGQPYMDLAPLHTLAASEQVAGRVRIDPGFIDDAHVASWFGPGTIAVFPYREIEASGVLYLALAHGRPIVASAIGSFAETLTDGVHGHLVPPDDVGALAAALAHLITDRAFAAGCAEASRQAGAGVADWTDIARATAELYREAIDGRVTMADPVATAPSRSAAAR